MKQAVVAGLCAGVLAVAGPAAAQGSGSSGKPQGTVATAGSGQASGAQAGKQASSATALGTVRIPRAVTANGERLAAGTYRVRLTGEEARPEVKGQTPSLERWVEFLQGNTVKGREVVSIVPEAEIAQVAEGKKVPAGSSRVEMLKGNEYLRVWINKGGNNYLIHMPPASGQKS
jgi:hypothetical protein